MPAQWVALIVLVIFGLALILLAATYSTRRRRIERQAWSPPAEGSLELTRQERMASPLSEVIEDMVNARMARDPDLKRIALDFATSADGGLEIWVDDERYESVDQLPASRLKTYIAQAVEQYNREHEGAE
jgi:hypothetical protein